MPTLHIEFNPTGGTLFEVSYRPVGSTNPYETVQVNGSPVDIAVPTADPYEYCIKKICEPGNDSVPICGVAAYIPPCATPQFSFASKSGNILTFNYVLQPNQVQFDIEITPPAGGVPVVTRYQTAQSPSPIAITLANMVTGTYRFRMRGVCGPAVNSAVSNWTDFADVAVVVSPCVAPSDIISVNDSQAPVVVIKWNDNQGQEERSCLNTSCSYTIAITATDINNDLSVLKVMKSTDDGVTWSQLFTTPTPTTFGDVINANGINKYKVIGVDLAGNSSESNILVYKKDAVIVPAYERGVPSSCYEQGWDNGTTGGNAWCQGNLDFKLSTILGISTGFIRLKINGDNGDFGLQRTNNQPIVIDQSLSVNEQFNEILYSTCAGTYPCTPVSPPATYTFEYSPNGTSNWQQFTLKFYRS